MQRLGRGDGLVCHALRGFHPTIGRKNGTKNKRGKRIGGLLPKQPNRRKCALDRLA